MQKEYQEILLEAFKEIIEKYALCYVNTSNAGAILFRKEYGFKITVRYDEVYFEYINRKNNDTFEIFDLWNYCILNSNDEDRIGLGKPITIIENYRYSFFVLARALKRRFRNILEGDKTWFDDYSRSELAGEPRPLDNTIKRIIMDYTE